MEEAMRNEDGQYVATKYMRGTGASLKGVGDTKEEARLELKSELAKYREAIQMGVYFQPTGEKVKSPGLVSMETQLGMIVLRQDDRREVSVVARPDLAKYIQGGSRGNYPKETRQIRRARERVSRWKNHG